MYVQENFVSVGMCADWFLRTELVPKHEYKKFQEIQIQKTEFN